MKPRTHIHFADFPTESFSPGVSRKRSLIDDLIGIWGDTSVTGEPAGAGLAARKKSLPIVAALRSATPAARELAGIYRCERPLGSSDVRRAAAAVELAGGRDWAQIQACDRMADAIGHLSRAVPDSRAADDLLALAELATRRNH